MVSFRTENINNVVLTVYKYTIGRTLVNISNFNFLRVLKVYQKKKKKMHFDVRIL